MPIILPTPVEFARMDRRQRDALRRRLDADALKALIDYMLRKEYIAHDPRAEAEILEPYEPVDPDAEEHRAVLERVNRRGRDRADVVEEFNHTWPRHGGQIVVAAPILGMTTDALEAALHRARRAGLDVKPMFSAGRHAERTRKERTRERAAG